MPDGPRFYALRVGLPGTVTELQVSGLRALAGCCESLAEMLADNGAPIPCPDVSWLSSGAAVNDAQVQVAAASARCAARTRATVSDLFSAANGYAENEAGSSAQLRTC